jgi:pilus assembly protein Flp/PilA
MHQFRAAVATVLHRVDVSHDRSGQGLAEYALILALIAIIAIVALIFMGSQVSDKLSVIGSQLDSVSP